VLVNQRVLPMRHVNRFRCKAPTRPPTIEFDLGVSAWYLRFSNARIVKTISEEKPGVVFAIDLDSKNEIVGLELIGVREFSISLLRKIAPIDTSKIDFEKARFVHAAKRSLAEA